MSALIMNLNSKQFKRPITPSQKILPSYSSKANNFFPEDFFGNSSSPKHSLNRPSTRCFQNKEVYYTKPKIRPMLTKRDFIEEAVKNTTINPFANRLHSKINFNNQISFENDIDPSTSGSYNNRTASNEHLLYQTPHFFPNVYNKNKDNKQKEKGIDNNSNKNKAIHSIQSNHKEFHIPKPKSNIPKRPQTTHTLKNKPRLKKINTNLIKTTRAISAKRIARGINKDISHQVVNKELSQLMENIPSYLIEDPEVKKGFDMLFKNIDDIKKVINKKSIEKSDKPLQKSNHIIKRISNLDKNNFRKDSTGHLLIKHESNYSTNQLCKNKSSNHVL